MKNTIIKIGLFLLIFCIAGQGCEKEEIFDPSIIGEWQYFKRIGGFTGISYPPEEEITTSEFTQDSILIKKKNNEVFFVSKFRFSSDTLISYGTCDQPIKEIIEISNDTLILQLSGNYLFFYYKRIKH